MTCMQLVKMKDTTSILTYMMCRKIYDPTSNHWSMGTYIVFCDFIKPRAVKMVDWKSFWFTLSQCCLEETHNSICCQLTQNWLCLSHKLVHAYIFIFSKRSISLISFNYQLFFLLRILLWSFLTVITNFTTLYRTYTC